LLHAPAVLRRSREPPVLILYGAMWAPELILMQLRRGMFLPLPGIEPQSTDLPPMSQLQHLLSYEDSLWPRNVPGAGVDVLTGVVGEGGPQTARAFMKSRDTGRELQVC
jgi:hypothetical protein